MVIGGGLRTGASCSWDLEKICNWFAVKGPVRSSSAKLRFVSTKSALLGDGGDKGRTYRLSVLEPLLRVVLPNSRTLLRFHFVFMIAVCYALAVNSDGRYLTTREVDRHVHKVQFVSAFMIMHLQVTGTLFFPYVSDTELQSSTLVHLIEVSRRALTVGRDRIMQLHKVDKAEKLDGGEGGKRGESLVARTLGV
ncbi:hypothetical protein HID58_040707 [Brassica napus]|uniref:Uncharacterized protein n=1 Tax=Brassica napus TaxID=3708 RepID=A0ABQ8B8U0_BRANA|nr:hypothetical protein HID58_040707 [Brassica napus]